MYSLLIRQPFPSAICCLANSRLSSLSIDLELLVLGTTLVSYLSISELNCKKRKENISKFFIPFTLQKKMQLIHYEYFLDPKAELGKNLILQATI